MMPHSSLPVQKFTVAACHAVALSLAGLQLYLLTLPDTLTPIPGAEDAESAWWGLWPITYLPGWLVVVLTLLLPIFITGYWLNESWIARLSNQSSMKGWQFRVLVLICVMMGAAFFMFPIEHTRWGDAYMLSKSIAWPTEELRLTHSWQAPLDVWLHSQIWWQFHEVEGWKEDASGVYRLLSPVAGATFLIIALAISRIQWPSPGWFTFSLLATLGLIQLFFGYVENYSFAAAGVLAYLWLGIRSIRKQRSLWVASSVLGLTNATHPSTIVLIPSLLYLGRCKMKPVAENMADFQRIRYSVVRVLFELALPLLFFVSLTISVMEWGDHGVAALVSTDIPGGGDARWFVPLFAVTSKWEHYTMFSWLHLRDFLNEQLLVAPVVLPSLLVAVGAFWFGRWFASENESNYSRIIPSYALLEAVRREVVFLVCTVMGYLLFVWTWNPDYGGQRDWDLFSLAALPLTLLLAWLLPLVLAHQRTLIAAAVPLLYIQAMHTAAWVYQNTLPWSWPD